MPRPRPACPLPPLYLTLSASSYLRKGEGVLGRPGRMMHGNSPRGVPAPPVSRPYAGNKRLRLQTPPSTGFNAPRKLG